MRRSCRIGCIYCSICALILIQFNFSLAQSRYILNCRTDLLLKSEEIMKQEVGTQELPNNRGEIVKYLKAVNLQEGNPYCAAGQYYSFLLACKQLGLPISEIPISRTGLSRKILADAKLKARKSKYEAERHDLIIWRMKGSSYRGHIERVLSAGKAGWLVTIGFNVDIGNGKEGVAIKRRNLYHIIGKLKVAGIIGFKGV